MKGEDLRICELTEKINSHPTKIGSDFDMLLFERNKLIWESIYNKRLEEALNSMERGE